MNRSSSIDTPYPYPLSIGTVCTVGVQNIKKSLLRFSLKLGVFVSHLSGGARSGCPMMISPAERIWSRHAEGCPNEIKCEAIVVYRDHVQMLSWLAVWESYSY